MNNVANIREAFLDMINNGSFEAQPDGDMHSNGGMVDLTTYKMIVDWRDFEAFLEEIGISLSMKDKMDGLTLTDAINRAQRALTVAVHGGAT